MKAIGQLKGNMRYGQGLQKWSDGAQYDGQWKDNKANGKGKFIYPDGDKFQILYDPNEPVRFESGGITTDTGAAQTDDRTSVVTPILNRQVYPNMWVTGPITEAPSV